MSGSRSTIAHAKLLADAEARFARCKPTDSFDTNSEPAELMLTDLDRYPHHFVLAALLDRQYRAGKVWSIPYLVGEQCGGFGFDSFRNLSQPETTEMFITRHLHRFPAKMAVVFHRAIQRIEVVYEGDTARIWSGNPPAARIVRRFLEFFGCGPKIATMATNILLRQFKVAMTELSSIDISADVQVRKYFVREGLLRPDAKKEEAIYLAREINPSFPGVLDLLAWEGGRGG